MRRCFILLLLGLIAGCRAPQVAKSPAPAEPSVPQIPWTTDMEAALAQARKTDQIILVDFWADWCGWCKKMDAETWLDPEVQRLASTMIPVKINSDQEPKLAAALGAANLPHVAFVRRDHVVIATAPGYRPADQMAVVLKGALEHKNDQPRQTSTGDK